MKWQLLTAQEVAEFNSDICITNGLNNHCYGIGKVESALSSAFYPGDYPFVHGGVAAVAGALCFYITQAHAFFDGNKRTALIASTVLLRANGWRLRYPMTATSNALSDLIEACASSEVTKVTKEQMMKWFDDHKVAL